MASLSDLHPWDRGGAEDDGRRPAVVAAIAVGREHPAHGRIRPPPCVAVLSHTVYVDSRADSSCRGGTIGRSDAEAKGPRVVQPCCATIPAAFAVVLLALGDVDGGVRSPRAGRGGVDLEGGRDRGGRSGGGRGGG